MDILGEQNFLKIYTVTYLELYIGTTNYNHYVLCGRRNVSGTWDLVYFAKP